MVTHAAVTAGFKWAPDTLPVAYTPIITLPAKAEAAMGGPPAYLAAETAPQPPATIVNVPTASAAHLAASEYVGLSSAILYLSVRRVDGVDADGMSRQLVLCGLAAALGYSAVIDRRGWIVGVLQLPQT